LKELACFCVWVLGVAIGSLLFGALLIGLMSLLVM
jgi:hypothetical protein